MAQIADEVLELSDQTVPGVRITPLRFTIRPRCEPRNHAKVLVPLVLDPPYLISRIAVGAVGAVLLLRAGATPSGRDDLDLTVVDTSEGIDAHRDEREGESLGATGLVQPL